MDEKSKSSTKNKIFLILGFLVALGEGITVGINVAVHSKQVAVTDTETDKESFDWTKYLGTWCNQGNEDNAESPRELYQVELKSVNEKNQTLILNAECYEGKRLAIEENLEGIIHNNCIEIGFNDFYGSRIEGEITAESGKLFVSLNEVPEKNQESELSYGTSEMPLEMKTWSKVYRSGFADVF